MKWEGGTFRNELTANLFKNKKTKKTNKQTNKTKQNKTKKQKQPDVSPWKLVITVVRSRR